MNYLVTFDRLFINSLIYSLKRLVAISFGLPQPNDNTTSHTINHPHRLDLAPPFIKVSLVDADSIYPNDSF